MNRSLQWKVRRQEPNTNPKACLLCKAGTGSVLAYRSIRARVGERANRERDIGQREIGEWEIRQRYIREKAIRDTVATGGFGE